MVERRRFGNLFAYAVLSLGVVIVAFPVYLCLIGSTHEQSVIANGQMPATPGGLFFQTYYKTLFVGTSGTTRQPVSSMLFNSFVMASVIAVGKIAISIPRPHAGRTKFPFRMAAFWLIFDDADAARQVRIYLTYKIAADLRCSTATPAHHAADRLSHGDAVLPPVLRDDPRRADRSLQAGCRRSLSLLQGYRAAAVQDQHRRAVRDLFIHG
jgi:hypothetical protein